MASTTLFTFAPCIPNTYSVHILGSWDNFTTPYPLEKDGQRGHGYWVGCHSFKNIVCDGDPSRSMKRRNGGLRMGGMYWYHYLLDGDIEYFDPGAPVTTRCPLLPGQIVNILDIPIELDPDTRPGSRSDCYKGFTLDPRARFKKTADLLRRKRPVSSTTFPFKDDVALIAKEKSWSQTINASQDTIHHTTESTTSTVPKPTDQADALPAGLSFSQTTPAPEPLTHQFDGTAHLERWLQDDRPETRHGDPVVTAIHLAGDSSYRHSLDEARFSVHADDANHIIAPSHLSLVTTQPSNIGLPASYEHEATEDEDLSLTHIGTPPQLCSVFSPDVSPQSVTTPSAPRLRRELRKLQKTDPSIVPDNYDDFADFEPWRPHDATFSPVYEASPMYINPIRLENYATAKASVLTEAQPEKFEASFHHAGIEFLDDKAPHFADDTNSQFYRSFPPDIRGSTGGFGTADSRFAHRDETFEDLAYLGSFIV